MARFYLKHILESKLAVHVIFLNTQDFCPVRLPTQGTTCTRELKVQQSLPASQKLYFRWILGEALVAQFYDKISNL
jgi:hypothetical protein